jgi:dipeptide/tripeptide permease
MQATFPVSCHSVGFPVLCAVQFLERMAGYMVAVSLALLLDEHFHVGGGLAACVAGYFLALSYAAAVPGGIVADRYLGASRAVRVAVLFLAGGYAVTLIGSSWAMAGGAALVVIGSGLFRPSVATITGTTNRSGDSDPFRWLYFVVNIAALIAPLAAGMLRARYGWEVILGCASALLWLASVLLHRCRGAVHVAVQPRPTVCTAKASQTPRGRLGLLGLLAVYVLLGVALHQTTGTLLFWARDDTRRVLLSVVIPPEIFAMLPGGLVLLYTPLLAGLSRILARRTYRPSPHAQIAAGLVLAIVAYGMMVFAALPWKDSTQRSPLWLVGCLALLTLAEAIAWPLGMRLVGDLVPPHKATQAHGMFSLATALGYWLAGEVGSLWSRWAHAYFFALLALVCAAALGIHVVSLRRVTEIASATAHES